ncbi:MAG: hypothetical protein AAGM36_10260 [Cyanobacteria bacterium J06597_1]
MHIRLSRRTLLQHCSATVAGLTVGLIRPYRKQDSRDRAIAQPLSPTPSCSDVAMTPEQFEGPFYLCDSPERSSLLESGMSGRHMVLSGQVLSVNCIPISNALVDFWQADNRGHYDEDGYRLRGHQFTDAEGRYRLETIIPGEYPGRTRHLHVKIQVPEQPFFTTQLFFPADPLNGGDRFFQPDLTMSVAASESWAISDQTDSAHTPQQASFNFVLRL